MRWINSTKATYLLQQDGKTNDKKLSLTQNYIKLKLDLRNITDLFIEEEVFEVDQLKEKIMEK